MAFGSNLPFSFWKTGFSEVNFSNETFLYSSSSLITTSGLPKKGPWVCDFFFFASAKFSFHLHWNLICRNSQHFFLSFHFMFIQFAYDTNNENIVLTTMLCCSRKLMVINIIDSCIYLKWKDPLHASWPTYSLLYIQTNFSSKDIIFVSCITAFRNPDFNCTFWISLWRFYF